jgi:hypothetical protein
MMMMPLRRGDDDDDDADNPDDPTFSRQPQQRPELLWILPGLRPLMLFDSATYPGPSAPLPALYAFLSLFLMLTLATAVSFT